MASTPLHDLLRIVPVLAEEAGRRRKRIGENLLFQSGPHKAIDRLQPVLDGGDLGGEVIQLLAGALTCKSCGGGQHQAVELIRVDQREPSQHPRIDPITLA